MACDEYSQEVIGFSDVIASGNPTPYYDPIVSTSSPTLTPFGDSDFLLKEVDAFLALEDDPTSREPQVRKELKICEAKNDKSSIDEPPEVELKDLPPHLEYVFLEGDDKLLVIIAKDLSVEEKAALIKVLKSHKQAITWKLSDIKGINPKFYTHKILMEDDFKPAVWHQRRVNSKIHDVIKKEVLKLLNAGLIYPISDSPWEKSHFMVKEGFVLGHKISKNGIEINKAKVDVIAKLPHPTTVKGETFMERRPEECYDLIENMTAHHNDWDTSVQRSESSSSITSSFDPEIVALKAEIAKINKNLMKVFQINQQVKTVAHNCKTCGGPHSYNDCPATVGQTQIVYAAGAYNQGGNSYQPQRNHNRLSYRSDNYLRPPRGTTKEETNSFMELVMVKTRLQLIKHQLIKPRTNMTSLINSNLELKNMFGQFMKMNTALSLGLGTLPSNTITNLKEDLKGITIRSENAYKGPTVPITSFLPKVVEHETEVTKDTVPYTNNKSTKDVQPLVVQIKNQVSNSNPVVKLVVAPVSALKPNPKPSILFADALILMPKFGPTIKNLLTNKEKLFELAKTSLNEHCSEVLLKKLPEKLGDPGKFLIPCDFPRMDECLALADLGASINLMPLSVWNKLSLPELSPTCMTLKLTDRLISRPVGVAKDIFVNIGTLNFPTDFVVVDFHADPRVPLILERSFLKTVRALIDVYEGELPLLVCKEAVTFNLDQALRYSANYDAMSVNRIDLIYVA
nr:reverse transcriptase domain-containing protein [Tanacetum cinerariifolium]